MSVLGNTKSDRHRKTYAVESGDAGRKSWHLTRGDLPSESLGEVSRGRSSEEAPERAWSEGPKDHETSHFDHLRATASRTLKRAERCNCGSHSGGGRGEGRWILAGSEPVGYESKRGRRRKREGVE
jgi:hypothetical protein